MAFTPPNELFTGGGTFTSPNIYNDNVFALFGTDQDASLGYITTGAGATSPALWYGLPDAAPFFFIGNEVNKNYDPLNVDVSGFFSDPIIFLLSSAQKRNEHTRFQISSSSRNFSFNGSNGDNLDGTTTTDDGIGLDFRSGSGGTQGVGGDGGTITFTAQDGGGTSGTGGSYEVNLGAGSGTGLNGKFTINQAGSTRLEVNTDGSFNVDIPDNNASAYEMRDGSNKYLEVVTTNGSEKIDIGGTGTDPDINFNGTGLAKFNGMFGFHSTLSSAGNYTVQTGDLLIAKTGITGGGDTVTLPASPPTSSIFIIIDASGSAGTNNITIDTTGSPTIDGAATYTINSNYGCVWVFFNGTNYLIISEK